MLEAGCSPAFLVEPELPRESQGRMALEPKYLGQENEDQMEAQD